MVRRKDMVLCLLFSRKLVETKDSLGKKKLSQELFLYLRNISPSCSIFQVLECSCAKPGSSRSHHGRLLPSDGHGSGGLHVAGRPLPWLESRRPPTVSWWTSPVLLRTTTTQTRKKCFWNYRKKRNLKQSCCPEQILFQGVLKRCILLEQRTRVFA